MVATLFETITQAITSMINALTSAISGITALFYVEGVEGASGHMTFLGVLLLIAVGVGIVYWAFGLIRGAVRRV